ncbi:MAG: extracellular solute-binding protein [Candidatus Limnocylindrales bacterium]
MNKRLLALIPMLVVVLTACASPVATSTPTAAAPGATGTAAAASPTANTGPVKLTVWARNYTVSQDTPWKTTGFEAAHPNVTIDLTGAPSTPQYNRIELSQAGAAADKPDIFQMDNIWLGQFVTEGITANLDSYYASWKDIGDVVPVYAESTKVNGAQNAAWFYSDIRLMIWSKDVFKKAGLDPEKGPATWDELFADAAAIKAKVPGVIPVEFPASSEESTVDRWYSYLYMTGSNVLSPDGTTAAFNDAGGQKALQLYVDLVSQGLSTKNVLSETADDIIPHVFTGSTGIMLATVGDGLGSLPTGFDVTKFQSTIGAALPPICTGCSPASTAGGWMLGINSASPNKDLAWEYLTDVTDGKNMIPFEVQFGRVPVRQSGLDAAAQFNSDPYFAQTVAAAKVAHFPPFIAKYTAMIEFLWTGMQQAINGDASVKDALDGAAVAVNQLLKP